MVRVKGVRMKKYLNYLFVSRATAMLHKNNDQCQWLWLWLFAEDSKAKKAEEASRSLPAVLYILCLWPFEKGKIEVADRGYPSSFEPGKYPTGSLVVDIRHDLKFKSCLKPKPGD
jgi:hypothetical protein